MSLCLFTPDRAMESAETYSFWTVGLGFSMCNQAQGPVHCHCRAAVEVRDCARVPCHTKNTWTFGLSGEYLPSFDPPPLRSETGEGICFVGTTAECIHLLCTASVYSQKSIGDIDLRAPASLDPTILLPSEDSRDKRESTPLRDLDVRSALSKGSFFGRVSVASRNPPAASSVQVGLFVRYPLPFQYGDISL